MVGTMVRVMRFQLLLSVIGMTGWTLTVYFIARDGPMPKSQLFWMGTLMRLETGFWSFLASSASLACASSPAPPSPEEGVPAVAAAGGLFVPEWSWAGVVNVAKANARAKMMSFFGFMISFTGVWMSLVCVKWAGSWVKFSGWDQDHPGRRPSGWRQGCPR